ncbi:hypothetical protein G5V57_24245 [Nordella sp. HKS 07]|uniref:hypothetical protein n=1 Tax=Nordella sp. HKS 07 TaxID=2712222 RepID=UPI0013E16C49|nr:hypothetical protein [Nordella sp. HKS 07]QIG50565.1 hypothetical protein G5V57_24245 [Nordella sp. HKS 07]
MRKRDDRRGDCEEAERLTLKEMADSRADSHDDEDLGNPDHWLESEARNWHTVDCFDLDEFIERERKK